MNIFILDEDPLLAAHYQCNRHIVKMTLETAQILCTVHHKAGMTAPYRPTHKNHPCVIWAGECAMNYYWLLKHGIGLSREYTRRYGKIHKSGDVMLSLDTPDLPFNNGSMTPFALAVPECYRGDDPVESYRSYYIHEKGSIAEWPDGLVPPWWPMPKLLG